MESVQAQPNFTDDYARKVLSRWLVVYVVVGLIVYAVVYFMVMSRGFSYTDYATYQPRQTLELQNEGTVI